MILGPVAHHSLIAALHLGHQVLHRRLALILDELCEQVDLVRAEGDLVERPVFEKDEFLLGQAEIRVAQAHG